MRDLVLLHGWAMSRGIWDPVIPALEPGFRVHNLDLPGYGADNGADLECYRSMAPDEILDEWSDRSLAAVPSGAVWMGWSLGAMVALNAARRTTGGIEALVLVSATPKFMRSDDWDSGVDRETMHDFLEGFRTNHPKTLTRFALLQASDTGDARRLAGTLHRCLTGAACDPAVMELGLAVLEQVDLRGVLREIEMPVRLIHGRHDRIVPHAAGAYLADHLPRGELVSLNAGHAPFVTQPSEFLEALPAWT